MVKLHGSVCIEAPAAQVWARLAQLEDIQLWSDAVVSARCEGVRSRGVCQASPVSAQGSAAIAHRDRRQSCTTRVGRPRRFTAPASGHLLPL